MQQRPVLVAEDIHKSFGELEVLKGISLAAAEGDVISIIGASGSGKSTFLRCINFLEQPDHGRILLEGEEIRVTRHGADQAQVNRLRTRLGASARRRILEGYHELKERHRARVDQLVLRLEQHEDALRSVGLAGFGAGLDAGLDVGLDAGLDAPRPGRRVASLCAQAFGLALLAPCALLGAALHYPAYRLIGVLAVRFARDEDDMIATIKVLTAMLLFPVTWVAIGALAAVVTSAWRGVVIGSLAPLLGYAALLFFEALERLIGVMRVRLLSWRRRDRVEALRRERRWIHDELVALAQLVAASRGDPE